MRTLPANPVRFGDLTQCPRSPRNHGRRVTPAGREPRTGVSRRSAPEKGSRPVGTPSRLAGILVPCPAGRGGRRSRMRLLQGARGRVAAGLAAVAVVGGVAAVGVNQADNVSEVHLLSGAAWLASAKVGQVTLLDGASAEVSGQVKVANPGDVLTVVQQGATAYAVNQTTGGIRR